MKKCVDRYLSPDFFSGQKRTVVDLGSMNVNGSYRRLFGRFECDYLGLDLEDGPGVDLVLKDPYRLPVADRSVDVVVCGQALEHCEFFWLAFQEMARVLKEDGYLFLITPSAGQVHRYPVDCYRFLPDSYHALAKLAGVNVLAVWRDERGPWQDLVGVFSRTRQEAASAAYRPQAASLAPPDFQSSPELDRTAGRAPYLDTLRAIHELVRPNMYLEIGVRLGTSLSLARCPSLGIDPDPQIDRELPPGARIIRKTSDDFFELDAATELTSPPDLAFIDGMHLFEFALRDFMNVERVAHPATMVVIDDILPNHPVQSSRDRTTAVWTGDVWKLEACLASLRPDLQLFRLDTAPTGLLVVLGLDPDNRVLWERYNPIVSGYLQPELDVPPASVLDRDGALDPQDAVTWDLLRNAVETAPTSLVEA